VMFAMRSILSKRLFANKAIDFDVFNLFFVISWMAGVLLLPVWAFSEGKMILDAFLAAWHGLPGALPMNLFSKIALNAICHATYNLCSYMFLSRADSPLSNSVTNASRRFFVMALAIIYFGDTNKLTPQTLAGVALLAAGVFAYVQARSGAKDSKKPKKDE
jgi:hypothetical protein